ncbi:MAG: IPT/TIG domain-containing protein/Subtilase family protein [Chloroflexi bacterium]|nr:MAG: IPT/TIG domain-containing protein/Subtilase family protein [Chloroflexota bacterium]
MGVLAALLIGALTPGDAPLRGEAPAAALPPLLATLADEAARLHQSGVPFDAEIADGPKGLRDAVALGSLRLSAEGAVQVEARLVGAGPPASALAAIGVVTEIWRADLGRAQLRVPPGQLQALVSLSGIRELSLPAYAIADRGSVTTEGDTALRADLLRQQTGLTGAGVRIGVISDGIDGLAAAQASGDLPTLADQRAFTAGGIDLGAEGTALLEIVYDIAPEASLYFAAASTTLEMIAAVNYLAERTDIVVDDLGFLLPDDQQSDVSQNTGAALNNPDWPIRAYVTSAGNWALRHYEGQFRAGVDGRTLGLAVAGPVHVFGNDGSTDQLGRVQTPYNEIFLDTGDDLRAVLHWDDPWDDSTNDYDLLLLDESGATVGSGTSVQGTTTSRPRERITFKNEGPSGTFRLVVQNVAGAAAPRRLEMLAIGSNALEPNGTALNFNTVASSMLAQSDAPGGVLAVAAVDHDPAGFNTVRSYSSRGPTNNGVVKPDLTAVDGVAITGSAGFATPFFGTSAAAPHVAAIAALLLEARPQLLDGEGDSADRERALLRGVLTGSAIDLGTAGMDTVSGAGRIDALEALAQLERAVVVVDSGAEAGPGSLREAIEMINGSGAGPSAILIMDGLVIMPTSALPPITARDVSVSGAATIDGEMLPAGAAGLTLQGADLRLTGITIRAAPGPGVHVAGGAGVAIDGLTLTGNGDGILIDGGATGMHIGATEGVQITGSAGDGVRVSGATTRDVSIQNSRIGLTSAAAPGANGGDGIRVTDGAGGVVVGAGAGVEPVLTTAQIPELVHTVRGRVILNGQPALPGTIVEVLLDGQLVAATAIGIVDIEGQAGFILTIPGPGLVIRFRVAGEIVGDVLFFEAGALSDVLLDVTSVAPVSEVVLGGGNTIAFNGGAGLRVEGAVTNRGNVMHSNIGGDLRGAPVGPSPPALTTFRFSGNRLTIDGSTASGTTIDLYVVEDGAAPGVLADGSGSGGALRYLGTALSMGGRFVATDLAPGGALAVTALATDAAGGTSLFAANLRFGPGPQIETISPSEGSNAGGTQVTISGAGLGGTGSGGAEGFHVFFGGREATVLAVDDTRAVVLAPAHDAGPVSLLVEVSDGRTVLLESAFTYLAGRLVTLQPGWNNVTWSGRRTLITAAIAPLAPRVNRVFSWDADAQRWLGFFVGAPSFLNTLGVLETSATLWLFLDGTQPLVWSQPPP